NHDGAYDLIYATVVMRWRLVSFYERRAKGARGKLISSAIGAEVDERVRRHPLGRGGKRLPNDEVVDDMNFVLDPPVDKREVLTSDPWTRAYEWPGRGRPRSSRCVSESPRSGSPRRPRRASVRSTRSSSRSSFRADTNMSSCVSPTLPASCAKRAR